MLAPKIQCEVALLLHSQFCLLQKNDDQSIESVNLVLREVIFCDDDILLANPRAAPVRERRIRSLRVGALHDQLGGGTPGGRKKELVLPLGKKKMGVVFRSA